MHLGHTVHVLACAGRPGPELRTNESNGVLVHRIQPPDEASGAAYWLGYSWLVYRQLRALERQYDFDVIVFPEYGAEGYVYLLDRDPWAPTPVVVHLHCGIALLAERIGWPESGSDLLRVGTHMEETTIRLADGLTSSSSNIADFTADYYDVPRDAIDVVHSGIDLNLFRPAPAPAKGVRPIVLFVGNVAENKGVVTAFEAVRRLRERYPDVVLQILGPDDDGLGARLAREGESWIELLAFVDDPIEMPGHYRRASVLCAPSQHEGGVGIVYLEAMACGLPVVAAANGGTLESVVDGETGYLVPAGDVEATAAALDRILGDPTVRRDLGEAARRHVEGYFGNDQYVERLLPVLERTVARVGGTPAALAATRGSEA